MTRPSRPGRLERRLTFMLPLAGALTIACTTDAGVDPATDAGEQSAGGAAGGAAGGGHSGGGGGAAGGSTGGGGSATGGSEDGGAPAVGGAGGEGIGGMASPGGEGGAPAPGGDPGTGGAGGAGGVGGAGGEPPPPLEPFSFFVTSLRAMQVLSGSPAGFGGDLRYGEEGPGAGLRGADKICAEIAEHSMPGAGRKPWRAFLSATDDGNGMVGARHRPDR
jgi:hypothetical protein